MVKDFNALRIKMASPEDIMAWSYGEVTKAETINYRTFRAEVDGLMDERIFGPSKDFECFCGKYKKVRYKGIVCDRCGVEVTHKRVRRERMGHVRLVSPVTHVWYSHGVPNRLAMILSIPQKKLETVIYYARYVITEASEEGKKEALGSLEDVKKQELVELEEELKEKLKEVEVEFKEEKVKAKKSEKDAKKLAMLTERIETNERKQIAHVKSAYSQKQDNTEQKFGDIESLISSITVGLTVSEDEHMQLWDYGFDFYEADMGAPAIKTLLQNLDMEEEIAKMNLLLEESKSEIKKSKAIQRKKLLSGMYKAGVKPEWIVLDVLPVSPPDLRPIIQLPGGRFATSDLNDLYRRVINRNNRLKRLIELGAPEVILRNERRMLQESVDALMDNSHRPGSPTPNSRGLPYKSLSDMLRGKQGRFRQNLLGKRVDYSGRAVIVPGPELKYYQCGMPKTIALELFSPFIIRELIARGEATNPKRARQIYEEKPPIVWDILEEVSFNRPVLLNRAPTLHKQSIIAFYPVLIEGNAIRLNPMMNKGFNADFDGDQMAVHLPLSKQAVEEARNRMFADSNMLSMANGKPIVNTEKDMAMGIYFLTLMKDADVPDAERKVVASEEELVSKYNLNEINLYEPVKLLMNGEVITTTVGRVIFNQALPDDYEFINRTINKSGVQKISAAIFERYGRKQAITFMDKMKALGFEYSRISGFSVSMGEFDFGADVVVKKGLAEFHQKEENLLEDFNEGLITLDELRRLQVKEWIDAYEEIHDKTWALAQDQDNNLIHLDQSGSTPVSYWVKQISGVRGTVIDPSGNVVDLPLMNNYRDGLNNFEYFVAARYTRKSFADVALRTADSGYLTRRLVDVAQNVVVKKEDCGTTAGISLDRAQKRSIDFSTRIKGRYLAEDVVNPETGEVIAKKGDVVTAEMAKSIDANESINTLRMRSPMTCELAHGVCTMCYGYDFGTGTPVEIGEAVGIIAAQSIGEPSTQLTLKNKSDARATGDVTQGLPRVEEIFEVRTPKAKAAISEMPGTVKIIENEEDVTIRISSTKKLKKTYKVEEGDTVNAKRSKKVKPGDIMIVKQDGTKVTAEYEGRMELAEDKVYLLVDREIEVEYTVDASAELLVKNGEEIKSGAQLTYGSIDPKELAIHVDVETALKYIIDEAQDVYGVYGIGVDDVHIEVIVAQMSRFGQVIAGGDSAYLPGEFVDRLDLDTENVSLRGEGKKQVGYERILLGITNAALRTESFLSAASFEQQVRILTEASLIGKIDYLRGLKENVIIGRPIPIGDVLKRKQRGETVSAFELTIGSIDPDTVHDVN